MKYSILDIKNLWKEILIILLIAIVLFYTLPKLFSLGLLGLSTISFSIGLAGGYLITKSGSDRDVVWLPAVIIVVAMIIAALPAFIDTITVSHEEIIRRYSEDPEWTNNIPSHPRLMLLGGALFALAIFSPVFFILGLVGAWIGKEVKQRFTRKF